MKRILLAAWLALAPFAAFAQDGVVNPQTDQNQLTRNKGQLPGTTANDNASAGNVGQLITSTCPTGNATITVTIASPAVVTYTAHGFSNTAPNADLCPIVFTTTGALPTGITAATTTYWTIPSSYATNTFQIATSIANALAGTAVNTSGSQSGTHTGTRGSGLSNAAVKSVTGLPLTAGDWDVWCTLQLVSTGTTMTAEVGGISSADGGGFLGVGSYFEHDVVTGSGANVIAQSPMWPLPLSGTATYFCWAQVGFAAGSVTANGKMVARRRR